MPRKAHQALTAEELAARARGKAERAREAAEGRRRRQLSAAGVNTDPRIAAGRREFVVNNIEEQSKKRASLIEPGALIKRQSERTEARMEAIVRFDDLCHRAYAGLFPEPKFERGVDVSHAPASLPNDRADALLQMQRLAGYIGDEMQAILHLRIFERQTFAWMAEQNIGDERMVSALFLSGVDAVARFYGLAGPSRAHEARENALRHV